MRVLISELKCIQAAALLAALLLGCQTKSDTFEEEPVKANLRQISKAYSTYLGYHNRPPDPEQLRSAVEDLHRLQMGRPAEEAMVSPRDKQPFVIIYGAGGSDPTGSILAYEAQGAEGTRWVVTMIQDIKPLTNEEFKKATFANKHKPSSS
jgi:hypothetical protein